MEDLFLNDFIKRDESMDLPSKLLLASIAVLVCVGGGGLVYGVLIITIAWMR